MNFNTIHSDPEKVILPPITGKNANQEVEKVNEEISSGMINVENNQQNEQ